MKVNKIIHAINMGWMKVDDEEDEQSEEEMLYDLWGEDQRDPYTKGKLPPPLILPKLVKPLHDESYNPPEEYLPTEKEAKAWKDAHPEDREKNYLPRKYDSLRKVEVYTDLIKERFERCLDLYLAPRVKKRKVHVDPDSLLPELPPPSSLKPFPSFANVYYSGHKHRIRSIKTDNTGKYLASGDESGLVLIFDVSSSRILKRYQFEDAALSIDWSKQGIILVAEGSNLHVIYPGFGNADEELEVNQLVDEAKSMYITYSTHIAEWTFYSEDSKDEAILKKYDNGLRMTIAHENTISQVTFHDRGDYFATVCPKARNNIQVLIHSFGKGKSQRPFAKSKSNIQRVLFHPQKPIFFIATQQHIWIFNLKT
jgi:ribosome biogenesis protein ERB1